MKPDDRPCSRCRHIRLFLSAAVFLLIALYLQPEGAMRLAGYFPSAWVIGIGVSLGAIGLFLFRLVDMGHAATRRSGRR